MTDTPAARLVLERAAKRAAMIQGLRDMADWLEASPQVPTPHEVAPYLFTGISEIRDAMHLTGPWDKDFCGSYVTYHRPFGAHVRLELNANRDEVCRKVQTGVTHVEAHDEPVYEWQCGPEDDGEAQS